VLDLLKVKEGFGSDDNISFEAEIIVWRKTGSRWPDRRDT
jgi:hypothetical protein